MRFRRRADPSRKPLQTTVETSLGSFACWEDDLITTQLRKFGAHQRSDLALMLSFVRPGDWVIDIGAHVGTFSVPLAWAVGSTGHVFAFEPAPENFALLCENIGGNGVADVVTPINAVVTRVVWTCG